MKFRRGEKKPRNRRPDIVVAVAVSIGLVVVALTERSLPFVDDYVFDGWLEHYRDSGTDSHPGLANCWSGLKGHFGYPAFSLVIEMAWQSVFGRSPLALDLYFALCGIVSCWGALHLGRALRLPTASRLVLLTAFPLSLAFLGHRPEASALAAFSCGVALAVSSHGELWRLRAGTAVAAFGAAISPTFLFFSAGSLLSLVRWAHAQQRWPISMRRVALEALGATAAAAAVACAIYLVFQFDGAGSLSSFLHSVARHNRSNPFLQLSGALGASSLILLSFTRPQLWSSARGAGWLLTAGLFSAFLLNAGTNPGRIIELNWQWALIAVCGASALNLSWHERERPERQTAVFQTLTTILAAASTVLLAYRFVTALAAPPAAQNVSAEQRDQVRREIEQWVAEGKVVGIDSYVYRYVLDNSIGSEALRASVLDYRFSLPLTSDCLSFRDDVFRKVDVAIVNDDSLTRYPFLRKVDYDGNQFVRLCREQPRHAWKAGTRSLSLDEVRQGLLLLVRIVLADGNRYASAYGSNHYQLMDPGTGRVLRVFRAGGP